MEYRNTKMLSDGRIDCEIKHPVYGWLPFTADPEDRGADFDVGALYTRMVNDPCTLTYTPPTQKELDRSKKARLANKRSTMSLSFAQLLIGLVEEGWITKEEGELWLETRLPPRLLTLILNLPTNEQFAAKVRVTYASRLLRNDPLIVALGQSLNKTDLELDAFFHQYTRM